MVILQKWSEIFITAFYKYEFNNKFERLFVQMHSFLTLKSVGADC